LGGLPLHCLGRAGVSGCDSPAGDFAAADFGVSALQPSSAMSGVMTGNRP
jgi:hypothetical protein